MERAVDPAAIGPVRAYCERRFPELAAAPVQAAHVCYETTADSHFIIDRHPDLERLARRRGLRPWLQARAGDRRLRRLVA